MGSNITLALTSCNRHELLRRTLDSFLQTSDVTPEATIIIEDSWAPKPEWLNESPYRSLQIQWIQNEGRKGQIYSLDRLYAEIKTDFVFHCEDDWEFVGSNFIQPSLELLRQHPNIWTVNLRGQDCNGHPLVSDPRLPVQILEPYWRDVWGGVTFNCGLRRLSDYKRIGSYGRYTGYGQHGLGHEMELSRLHLDLGYRIASLPRTYVVHTGGGCSRSIEPLPALPKILISVPACQRFEYGPWESEQSPHYNAATAWEGRPYGQDIHISGTNDRVTAVRETWARDTAAFRNHVDFRFFYGDPFVGVAEMDEVVLPCPDDYEHLPHKTIEICRWALEQGYDFLLKCDDDSYVWVDRLVRELMGSKFDYAGYLNHNVCSGGCGYWLSRKAMALVAAYRPEHWAEDVTVSHALTAADIKAQMLPNHVPGFSQHWFDIDRIPNGAVCIHALKPESMRELYRREHNYDRKEG
jgi:hypothetical protein